ncbi:BgTH12-01790 [Blumeria graminis f. sp. triticale]|uniref:BgTH12-01790 n=1 Tax=Blumeria graminis f. sp. triticale TaxID=1689686 RepID=A0A9W4CZQ6_BLUGR|nr:BgTH12-01790 [Blumeria graminis f. sp. triticale]
MSSTSEEPFPWSDRALSDVIASVRIMNVFAGFTRDFAPIIQRLEDLNQRTTILVPANGSIMSLPRKPWESTKDYKTYGEQAFEGAEGRERARANLQSFVQAHILPFSPWKEGVKLKTLAENEVWWQLKDEDRFVQPANAEVLDVIRAGNGEIWLLSGVLV